VIMLASRVESVFLKTERPVSPAHTLLVKQY